MELHIESRNIEMIPEWKHEIEERMTKLQSVYDTLIHGRVTLTKNLHHNKSEQVAEALVVVSLPGRHTITARKENKTFEEAIRAAFVAMQTELRRYHDRRAATDIRNPVIPLRGVISKLFPEQGYGFILQAGGGEVYFHRNAVHGFQFEDLEDGAEVAFNVEEGDKGPQATTVNPVPLMPS
jgi:ribosomal subunit interface protein